MSEQESVVGVELVSLVAELVAERDELRHRLEMLSAGANQAQASADEAMMTIDEAAQLARRHPKTIRVAIKSGRLRAFRPGGGRGRVLLRADDVRAWLESRPAAEPQSRSRPRPGGGNGRRGAKPALGSAADLREIKRNLQAGTP
jgi:excisionase family DNA binding protein